MKSGNADRGKEVTQKEYEEWQKYKAEKAKGHVLLPDTVRFICEANGYDAGNWSRDLKEGEYLSVHVLAVSSDCYQSGVGSFMVGECIAIARSRGYKAVRLDIVPTNTPAERLNKKNGFVYAGTVDLNRPTAPIPLFDLYEFNLD